MGPLTFLASLLIAAPEITAVAPAPLPRLATAEITGAGFAAAITSVKVAEVTQQVLFAEPGRVRFLVSGDTPLGAQTLTVAVGGAAGGVATTTVEVVAAMPKVSDITPDPMVLGQLGTIVGTDLDGVSAVTLGEVPCVVTEQTGYVLVFIVPHDHNLLGQSELVLASPSGAVMRDVTVSAPPPVIDALVPNPLRAGGLLTIRGQILPLPFEATIDGAANAPLPVLSARVGEVTVFLPADVAPGPHQVTIRVGAASSAPAGPLNVLAADERAPEVDAVYPTRVARGGEFIAAGDDLDAIDEATGGLEVLGCERHFCRVGVGEIAPSGRVRAALSGPNGAALLEFEVIDEAPVAPMPEAANPRPVFRGDTLVVTGARLESVRSVLIGGVAQSIALVDAGRVELVVAAQTSLGSESLVLVGNTASAAIPVTVLDPLPPEPGPEQDVASGEVTPEPVVDVFGGDSGDPGSEAERGGGAAVAPDAGCAGGGVDGRGWWACGGLLAFALGARRISRRARPRGGTDLLA